MQPLLDVPRHAMWPRYMSPPHPRASGSFGAELARSARRRSGSSLRWWQRLAAVRKLEHDDRGRLVWPEWLETTARQVGKSTGARELAVWRVQHADRFGEPQFVLHLANKLATVMKIQAAMHGWARSQGWKVMTSAQKPHVAAPDGSEWQLFSATSVYGFSAGLALVDECWDLEASVVTDGVQPTMVERAQSQLGLMSTAHPEATSLFPDWRASVLDGLSPRTLLLEWSAPAELYPGDELAQRMASPHWSPQRRDLVAAAFRKALRPVGAGEPDPMASFRAQWLNQWPERRVGDSSLPGARFLPLGAWEELEADLDVADPVFAVNDVAGTAVAVAAAGFAADGRLSVQAYLVGDRAAAYGWVEASASVGSQLVVGSNLAGDHGVVHGLARLMRTRTATWSDTRAGLSAVRYLVGRRVLVHPAGLADLSAEVEAARVADGALGLKVVSSQSWDLLRVVLWAVVGADRARR